MLLAGFLAVAAVPSADQPRPEPRPPRQQIDLTGSSRTIAEPGPVLRAESLAGLPPLPADGVLVGLRCMATSGGGLSECQAIGTPSAWDQAALRRTRGYRFDFDDLDLGYDADQPVALSIRLRPGDQQPLAIAGSVDPDASQIVIVSQATGRQLGAFYPQFAIRAEIELNFTLTCRVLDDQFLFCPEGELPALQPGSTPEGRERLHSAFLFAAQQHSGVVRVAPTLKDGRPSAGHQFRMVVAFRLPDE